MSIADSLTTFAAKTSVRTENAKIISGIQTVILPTEHAPAASTIRVLAAASAAWEARVSARANPTRAPVGQIDAASRTATKAKAFAAKIFVTASRAVNPALRAIHSTVSVNATVSWALPAMPAPVAIDAARVAVTPAKTPAPAIRVAVDPEAISDANATATSPTVFDAKTFAPGSHATSPARLAIRSMVDANAAVI